jgi:SAM-dependent methyltransferase
VTDDASGPLSLTPEQRAERAASFGDVAAHYDRYRPGPPPAAVDFILPVGARAVVDLGAGTGGLTRVLVGRVNEVIAVEPDDRMRAVLAEAVPGARALPGRGESIPIADGSVDAVIASSSWHWMDLIPTLHEVGRVLVPGGMLGVVWSGPDRNSTLLEQARALLGGANDSGMGDEAEAALAQAIDDPHAPTWVLEIPDEVPFDQPESTTFTWDVDLTADDLIGLLGTFSWVILMDEDAREQLFETARRFLRDFMSMDGATAIPVPYRAEVWRARRRS